jgi:hypothetical protein
MGVGAMASTNALRNTVFNGRTGVVAGQGPSMNAVQQARQQGPNVNAVGAQYGNSGKGALAGYMMG